MWVYLNGRFVEQKDAVVSVFDQGFLYGDGVFDTLRAYRGRLFLAERHLARLHRSCACIGIPVLLSEQGWLPVLKEVLSRNRLQDCLLRITITRGEGKAGQLFSSDSSPTVVICPRTVPQLPASFTQQGISVTLVKTRRNISSAIPAEVKSLSFLNNILAKQEAIQCDAYEGLMLNTEGYVAEGATSNVFFVESGRLYTPSSACGILQGITREVVIHLARDAGIPVEEGSYESERLVNADECFLTNTAIEILPVKEIDCRQVGIGCPGIVTKQLQMAYQKMISQV